jgi:hypothetical protein
MVFPFILKITTNGASVGGKKYVTLHRISENCNHLSLLRMIKAWVMLLLFVVYQVGVTSFVHVHIVNGVTVVHSHLLGDSEHDHTEAQVKSIELTCHYVCSDVPEAVAVAAPSVERLQADYAEALVGEVTSDVPTFCLRGPPAVC